jgi:type I restriction enzyme S subunit
VREGWQVKTLGEICEIAPGGSPRPIQKFLTDRPDGINWIKIGDATASDKYIYKTNEKIKPEGVKRSRLVKDGDFLLSNSMSFGRPYIMRTTGCIHDGWLVLSDKSGLFDQDYLYYFLGSAAAYKQFDGLAAGSTVRNLNTELVKRVVLPLPPLAEQQRIVTVLDEAFAGLATVTANVEKNLKNSREVFDSYLDSVITRKGEGWKERLLGELCFLFVDSAHRTPKYQPDGIPALRPRDVVNGELSLTEAARVSEEEFEIQSKRHRPAAGDIVYSRELSYGWAAVLPESPRVCLSQGMCLFRPNSDLDTSFLLYVLNGPIVRKQAVRAAVGTAHPHINLGDIKGYRIPVPSLDEQRGIAGELDVLSEWIQRLASSYTSKLNLVSELKQSILRRAFSGELTSPPALAIKEAAE